MKKNHTDLKFSTLKIKRIIQENKDIGKIANMTPYVISKSLEYFLKDLLVDCTKKAAADGIGKVYSYHVKNSIMSNPNYQFLSDLVEDIPEEKNKKKIKNKKEQKEPQN